MIRGLTSSWKQAIGYYLAAGGTKSATLQRIVIQAIDLVSTAGGHVKLMVCDQGSNNIAFFSQLNVAKWLLNTISYHHHHHIIFNLNTLHIIIP